MNRLKTLPGWRLAWIICFVLGYEATSQSYTVGQQSFVYFDSARQRPLKVEIWYPSENKLTENVGENTQKTIFKSLRTAFHAPIASGNWPMLVLSHGTGGNRFSLNWLVQRFVPHGYVMVAVDHYGNTFDNKIPREFLKWWERATDISYVISHVLKEEDFLGQINQNRIGGIGFSLGGYTQIALAGGKVDRALVASMEKDLPPEFPETAGRIHLLNDQELNQSYELFAGRVKDKRIKSFFVMAPALGSGFDSSQQFESVTAPVFMVAGRGDTNTPIASNAQNYHRLISTSKLTLFNEFVGHYVFLNEPTEFGKKVAPDICVDHPRVNRKEIHDTVFTLAKEFFDKNL